VTQAEAEVGRPEVHVNLHARARTRSLAGLRALLRTHAIKVLVATAGVVFVGDQVLRHAAFQTHRFDLGNMTQAVWNTAHGHFLETTSQGGDQLVRLGVHVEPLLVVFALPLLVWQSPLVLLIAQVVVIALGALPVYWLAQKHIGSERAALRFAAVYLLYPATQWNALGGFHPVSMAIAFLLFAIWYLDEDRLLPFLVFALIAATTKEEMPLLVAGLALWHAQRRGAWRAGTAIAGVGVAWFVVNVFVIIPHFAVHDTNLLAQRYASIGGSPRGILGTLVSDPGRFLAQALTIAGLLFVVHLLAALAGLSLLEPRLAACALPGIALCLLADRPEQRSITQHYTASIAPFLIAAAVLGVARLGKERARKWSGIALVATAATGFFSPLLFVPSYALALFSPVNAARAKAVALVPKDAPVATTNQLGGHMSERRRVYSVPVISKASWLAVDVSDPTIADEVDPPGFARFLRSVEHDRRWTRVYACDGVFVFRRTADRRSVPQQSTCP
jgi:uncharacterized membrane protein